MKEGSKTHWQNNGEKRTHEIKKIKKNYNKILSIYEKIQQIKK